MGSDAELSGAERLLHEMFDGIYPGVYPYIYVDIGGRYTRIRPEEAIRQALEHERLEPRDKLMLQLRYGLDGWEPHTLAQIGAKLTPPRTPERIRQILRNAQRILRRPHLNRFAIPDTERFSSLCARAERLERENAELKERLQTLEISLKLHGISTQDIPRERQLLNEAFRLAKERYPAKRQLFSRLERLVLPNIASIAQLEALLESGNLIKKNLGVASLKCAEAVVRIGEELAEQKSDP